jgi:hypothetical protein
MDAAPGSAPINGTTAESHGNAKERRFPRPQRDEAVFGIFGLDHVPV